MIYKFLFRHVISKSDPEVAHVSTMHMIGVLPHIPGALSLVRAVFGRGIGTGRSQWVERDGKFKVFARPIPGRFGLAAGLDKQAEAVATLSALGFGFVEIGTITPRPQPGNDKPRLWRIVEDHAIRNQMGFNNDGARVAAKRLRHLRQSKHGRAIIVGANIGKNKTTPLENAVDDYRHVASQLAPWVDYMVINVSSPNTPGLRSLQDVHTLAPIIDAVREASTQSAKRRLPLFVKIAPDLHNDDIKAIADLVCSSEADGIIATNTTIDHAYDSGGVSGRPLKERSLEVVRYLRSCLPDNVILIGCGGVETLADAIAMREAGADLVQGLTAFIYEGPSWPGKINCALH